MDSRTTPAVGTVTAPTRRSAHRRDRRCRTGTTSATAGGTPGATRCPSQALGLQVIAARAGRSTVENAAGPAAAGLAVGHADGRARAFDAWLDTAAPPPPPLNQGARLLLGGPGQGLGQTGRAKPWRCRAPAPRPFELFVVHAREEQPPPGVEPLEWFVLTTLRGDQPR